MNPSLILLCQKEECIRCKYVCLLEEIRRRVPTRWIIHRTPQWGEGIGIGATGVLDDGSMVDMFFSVRPPRTDDSKYVPVLRSESETIDPDCA